MRDNDSTVFTDLLKIFGLAALFCLLIAMLTYFSSGGTNHGDLEVQIEAHKQAAERALATADSLQAIIDIRELQIKTIYETLDHIPDYVRGMSAAERDSLRAIINPPY